jgi:hypothetical protein
VNLFVVQATFDETIQSRNRPLTANRHQLDLASIARLEPNSGSSGDVQPHPVCRRAVEHEIAVHLEEMKVRADLNGTIAVTTDLDSSRRSTRVQLNGFGRQQVFAWMHVLPALPSLPKLPNLPYLTHPTHLTYLTHLALSNGLMNRDQLRSIWKRAFHLNLGNHLGNALHHRIWRKDRRSQAHDVGNGPAIPNQLQDFRRDERDRLGMIELQAAGTAFSRDLSGGKDQQLVDFARRQVH